MRCFCFYFSAPASASAAAASASTSSGRVHNENRCRHYLNDTCLNTMARHAFHILPLLPLFFLLRLFLPPLLDILATIFAVNSTSCKTIPFATSAMGVHMLIPKLQVASCNAHAECKHSMQKIGVRR